MLTTILAFIIVLGVLIFVHELGHFLTAKAVDIEVPRFSIGLGPVAFGFRRGETEYVISWLPLGGYVRMAGMEDLEAIEGGPELRKNRPAQDTVSDAGLLRRPEAAAGSRTFESKSLSARFLVISAGVIMNFLFAVVVFMIMAMAWGVEQPEPARIGLVIEEQLPAGTEALAHIEPGATVVAVGDRRVENWRDLTTALLLTSAGPTEIRFADRPPVTISVPADDEDRGRLVFSLAPVRAPLVGQVASGTPAAEAGLLPGDRVTAVDGEPVESWHEMAALIEERAGVPVDLRIQRDGVPTEVSLVPEPVTVDMPDGERVIGRIGVAYSLRDRLGLLGSVRHGFAETARFTALIVRVLRDLITGQMSPRQLGGPILIGQISGEAARAGLEPLLGFMALLSVNLAVLNLLPIPILDGGQLVFLAIEAIRGRGLTLEQRLRLSQVGLVIILAIMVWAFASDLLRVFGL